MRTFARLHPRFSLHLRMAQPLAVVAKPLAPALRDMLQCSTVPEIRIRLGELFP